MCYELAALQDTAFRFGIGQEMRRKRNLDLPQKGAPTPRTVSSANLCHGGAGQNYGGFPSRCSPAPGSLERSILLMIQLIPLATVIAILIAPCARGQSSLDADLERFQQTSAKVVADLTAAKTLQISSAKTIYLQALQMADRQATLQGNIEAVKDTIAEETALSENRNLPATPGTALPKNLFNMRASYLQTLLKAEQAFLIRQKQFSTDQLRALGALESRARVANNAAILEKLEAEKTKLLSDAPSRLPKVRKTPVQANRRASVSIS